MHYDVKNSGVRDRTQDLWIRKRACYPLQHSAPYLATKKLLRCLDEVAQRMESDCSQSSFSVKWSPELYRRLNENPVISQ